MNTTTTFNKKPLVLAVGAALAGTAPQAMAQSDGGDDRLMEEILVTATARETRVQDIPYNISAISGDAIEAQNMVDQHDVLRSMHGISVVDRGFRNSGTVNSIVIRGLNVDNGANGDIQLNAVPTVATYYDNSPMYANFLVKDLERVEVLRGPQGTLYGSGSLGGTVRYMTRRPDAEEFAAKLALDYGQTSGSDGNNMGFDAMVNIPVGDKAAIRAVYSRIDNDGVIDYVNAYQLNSFGEPLVNVGGDCVDPRVATDNEVLFNVGCFESIEDADSVEIDYARVAFRAEPTDTFALQLTYHKQDDDVAARRATTLGSNIATPGDPLYVEYGDDDNGAVLLEPSEREAELTSLDLEFDFGFATFTSTTSLIDHVGQGESDNGGLWATGSRDWNYNIYGGAWPRPAQRAERGYDDEVLVQEFRLVSDERDGNIDWLVGGFYMDQETEVWQLSYNPGMQEFNEACRNTGDPVCTVGGWYGGFWPRFYPELTEIDFDYKRTIEYEEMAIYGELTYHFSDTFRLTGGLRWFDNETVNNSHLGFPLIEGSSPTQFPESTDSDDDILVKLNASWDLAGDKMLYATYSEGYRHGGAQAVPDEGFFAEPNAEAIRSFKADSVTNYEVGLKGVTDKLSYTISAFHVDWDDPQLNTVTSRFAFYIAANGDKASTQGIEAELEGYIGDSFHYRAGYTYVKAELDKDFISPQTGNVVAPAGSDLPSAPTSVLSLTLEKNWNVATNMDFILGVNSYYQSESENFIENTGNDLSESFDDFWLLGANATLAAENWNAMLYVRNAGDEAAPSGSFPSAYFGADTGIFESWYGNGNRQFIVQPRTIGLRFTYEF
jgi:outer membrane receptor protein involved in Fe transport